MPQGRLDAVEHTPAVDDYLKVVYSLLERGDGHVGTSALAGKLGVSASSVSGMVRRLVGSGLVAHRPYGGITLTADGTARALQVLRRHRLLECYLVSELGYGWDEVHDEAEVLEHHISDLLLSRIDTKLGHPSFDPHGDPIPREDGTLPSVSARRLSTVDPGTRGRLVRVDDEDPDKLRYLAECAVALGDTLTMLERRPFGGPFRVSTGDGDDATEHEIGPALAEALWVGPAG